MKDIGIYIHVPFCKRKCYYCDFVSYCDKEKLIKPYVEALLKEIESVDLSKYNIKTVYIGGGTPSILSGEDIKKILGSLDKGFDKDVEITIEVNPGAVSKEKLEYYKRTRINRISIGLQSANDKLLKEIGRIHSFKEFLDTYNYAKNVGFKNINVDLMLGLPNQTLEDIEETLKIVISLEPKHISLYSLILEEGTKLEARVRSGKLKMIDEDLERKMYHKTKKILQENGYMHYEISNFAKKRL